jgi:hypothetical protein
MAASTGAAPFTPSVQAVMPPVATGADLELPVYQNNTGGVVTVTSITYTTVAAITGAVTNTRTFNVFNRKGDNTGVALVATLAMVNAVNTVQNVPKTIVLSATPANLDLAAGDVLTLQSLHVGTGIADPGGLVQVTVSRA